MVFLVIGLGSMGKRRIRNLQSLSYQDIIGYDINQNRLNEVKEKYGISVYEDFDNILLNNKIDVFIISTPPNMHMKYANIAYNNNIHCFIEASVIHSKEILKLSQKIEKKDLIIVPSCTMAYYGMPLKVKELIAAGIIGKPLNINYQCVQYLPDWHPWEDINDYYVSNPSTSGCREIVPFELTWLNKIFGYPNPLACVKRKLTDMQADIDDIYHCILQYPNNLLANITIEVISRPKSTREITILGDIGKLSYSADTNILRYINTAMDDWKIINFESGSIEKGYINPEEPYINEMEDFLNAIIKKDIKLFPNSLKEDYDTLNLLYKLEELTGDDIANLSR